MPILLLGQWSPIPADLAAVLRAAILDRLVVVRGRDPGVLFLAMAPLLRRDPLARFWAAGMLFAAIPVSATIPMDRLLTFVGIGAAGLLAQFWGFVFAGADAPVEPRWWRIPMKAVAWFLVAVHAVIAPIALPLRAANPLGPGWVEKRLYVDARWDRRSEDRTVVIVNAPSPVHASYLILRRELGGQSVPRHTRVLAPAIPSVTIHRLDERTLAIRPRGGYLRWVLDQVFRSERRPFALGEQVRLTGMTVTISCPHCRRPAGRGDRSGSTCPWNLRPFVWLCFRGGGFEPFRPPAVGQAVEIRLRLEGLAVPYPAYRSPDRSLTDMGLRYDGPGRD